MRTISIINGTIIQEGRVVSPRECKLGLHVEHTLEYFVKNRIDMELTGEGGCVSLTVHQNAAKQKLIQALIDDEVIKPHQLLRSA